MSVEQANTLKTEEELYLELQSCYPEISIGQLRLIEPELLLTLHKAYPNLPVNRVIPISLEATRKKERLSSTPFYAERAKNYPRNSNQKCEYGYWIRLSISYQGDD